MSAFSNLNKQKESLLAEENDRYKLYRLDPNILETGHPISKETCEALIRYLKIRR